MRVVGVTWNIEEVGGRRLLILHNDTTYPIRSVWAYFGQSWPERGLYHEPYWSIVRPWESVSQDVKGSVISYVEFEDFNGVSWVSNQRGEMVQDRNYPGPHWKVRI